MENMIDPLFRWIHVVSGVIWIGLLYFFNFVNSSFAPTMDGETKKKVIPQLMPRALFWFRWGAAFTWFSGIMLLAYLFYHQKLLTSSHVTDPATSALTNPMVIVAVAVTLLGFLAYDVIAKAAMKDPRVAFGLGFVLASGVVLLFSMVSGLDHRSMHIHLGAMFGTIMAFNVWFRIWPSQKKIISAIRDGQPPDAALVALAGGRSKHNTYMSVPLIFTMVNSHSVGLSGWNPWLLIGVILVGWLVTWHLYKIASKVPGF
jgi:uncharacterized membrane protein